MIDTVVFDLGNVLIPWDVRWLLKDYFVTTEDMETFLQEIDFLGWNVRQDAGYPVAQATAEMRARFPQHREAIEAIYPNWQRTMGPADPATVALLQDCRAKGLRTFALSNFSAELFHACKSGYDFWNGFDGIVISGEEGVNKPDAAIYRILFERYEIEPARAVFMDDSLANVEGSCAAGMPAIHFTTADAARRELEAFGLSL